MQSPQSPTITLTGDIKVILNGASQGTYELTGRLLAFGQAGDDDIKLEGGISLSAWLYGDAGNDRLKGGAGHDAIFGGDGDDLLLGKSGRDLLIGGVGADRIIGNADDDILIAGSTAFDFDANRRLKATHERSLLDIMQEWTSSRDYAVRVANLTNGSGSTDGENGSTFLKTGGADATVFDDDDKDVLTGSSGSDWFFFDLEDDRATDLKDEVFANDLDFIQFQFLLVSLVLVDHGRHWSQRQRHTFATVSVCIRESKPLESQIHPTGVRGKAK